MKKIAFLLTCYNRKVKTIQCLTALYNCTVPDGYTIAVYLVDDGSTDNTAKAVKLSFPLVNIIQGTGNLYWNRGMHLAWKTAIEKDSFDFFIWLNDDTLIFNNAIVEVLDCYKISKPDAIICGSTCSEVSKDYTYGGKTLEGKKLIPNGIIQECKIMEGNFVLISSKIHTDVGNIDPIFPHAIGDHDYGLRAIKKGYKIFVARSYIGYCEGHESLPKWCLKEIPFLKRVKSLYSPLGNSHPKYFFIYEKRHYGLYTAIKHFASIHLRILIPQLWK